MKLIIDIDGYEYKRAKELVSEGLFEYNGTTAHLFKSVVNGKPISNECNGVLNQISEEVDDLRNYSYLFTDMVFDEVQKVIDKYKE